MISLQFRRRPFRMLRRYAKRRGPMLRLRLGLLFMLMAMGGVQSAAAASLNVLSAWVRLPAPGIDLAAVYFTVRNVSAHTVTIEGADAPVAGMAMLHESTIANGKVAMRMRETVVLAPGQSVQFAPNGLHLMLHGLNRKLLVGEKLPVILRLTGGEQLAFTATVRPLTE
jgi:copper(I)-binding protein